MTADVYATTVLGYPPISTWVGFITEPDGSRWYASGLNQAGHADHWSRDPDDALQFTGRAVAKRAVLLRGGAVTRSA